MNDEKKQPIRPLGHGKPVTRRELISQGVISGGAMVLTPSFLGAIYSQTAEGQESIAGSCPQDPPNSNADPAAIVIELSGGGNIAGANVFVGGPGGQGERLQSYASLGGGPATPTTPQYGLVWNSTSRMLQGINSIITDQVIKDKVKGILYCTISNDDLQTNLYLPTHHLVHAGAFGNIAKLVGKFGNESGTRTVTGFKSPGLTAVSINSPNDVRSIVERHKISLTLSDAAMSRILETSKNMGIDSLCKISRRSLSEQMAAICGCRYEKSYQLATKFSADALDPTKDAEINRIYGTANATDEACISKVVIDGNAGVGVILKDGYDYHDGTRTTGDAKDFEAGVTTGRILAYAASKGRAVSIMIVTDGGVSSNASGAWVADSGVRGAALQFSYHPNGVQTLGSPQIGAYKNDETVNAAMNAVSNSPSNLALAFTANYLALTGKQDDLQKLFPNNPISASLQTYLVYKKSS
jgi:hypothetical protein